jgi:outer membrane lipoprotein-sorting protein
MTVKNPARRERRPISGQRWSLGALAAALLLAMASAAVAAAAAAPRLGDAEAADVARIERYLNNIRTMTARFLQVTSEGGYAEGTLFLSRPGRLRIEYDPPVPVLIVADGRWMHFCDFEIGQVNRLRITDTPAAVLVREKVDLGEDIRVASFERGPGTIRMTVEDAANPESGGLTLTFSDKPLMLRQWMVSDAHGVETTVAISDTRRDVPLSTEFFEFPPKGFEFRCRTEPRVPFGQ